MLTQCNVELNTNIPSSWIPLCFTNIFFSNNSPTIHVCRQREHLVYFSVIIPFRFEQLPYLSSFTCTRMWYTMSWILAFCVLRHTCKMIVIYQSIHLWPWTHHVSWMIKIIILFSLLQPHGHHSLRWHSLKNALQHPAQGLETTQSPRFLLYLQFKNIVGL